MKRAIIPLLSGLLCIHSSSSFAQRVCTAGEPDLNFGLTHTGYVQISPVLRNYVNTISGESEVLDASGASYSVTAAATDSVGYGVADIVKVKRGGMRDWSFGGFGSVVPPPPATETFDAALAADSAGNLVLASIAADQGSINLYRYSATGVLDTTFGTTGIATVTATLNGPWAIKAASDGSIFVAAGAVSASQSYWQPVVFKLTPAGTLDTSFGAGGFSYFYSGAFGPTGKATDLSIQSDGSILVGGRVGDNSTYNQFFVARLLPNGALDTSFGANSGMTVVSFGGVMADGRKMAIQSDGKIVLVGGIGNNPNLNFSISDTGVIRLTANGLPDPTFGGTGTLHLTGFHGWQVALEDNDKILVAATQPNAQQTASNALVVRLTTSGQLDPTFGPSHNGIATLAVPGAVNAGTSFITYEPGDGIHVLVTGTDATGTISTEYLLRLDAGSGKGCH
jgi:uncharacterized delta-60 repeat protein